MVNNFKNLDLFSMLVFEAIRMYIHPTRYRKIIEMESSQVVLPNEQKWISEDQKHSSNCACVHYQKKSSREVAIRGRWCMQKLVDNSKNLETECKKVEQSHGQDDVRKDTQTTWTHELTKPAFRYSLHT